jgi:hypothetical protein
MIIQLSGDTYFWALCCPIKGIIARSRTIGIKQEIEFEAECVSTKLSLNLVVQERE